MTKKARSWPALASKRPDPAFDRLAARYDPIIEDLRMRGRTDVEIRDTLLGELEEWVVEELLWD